MGRDDETPAGSASRQKPKRRKRLAEDKPKSKKNEELIAIARIQKILDPLSPGAQRRIMDYLDDRRAEEDMAVLEGTE